MSVTGYKGVRMQAGRYQARAGADRSKHVGTFVTAVEAHVKRLKMTPAPTAAAVEG